MFGIRIQESLDYQVTMVAGWCIQPFDWTPACDRQTDRQTDSHIRGHSIPSTHMHFICITQ